MAYVKWSGESRNRRVVPIGTIVEVLNSINSVTAQLTVVCLQSMHK